MTHKFARTVDRDYLPTYESSEGFNQQSDQSPESLVKIDNPSHYTRLDPEPWHVVYRWFGVNGCMGHILSYLARAGHKEGNSLLCDLKKARNWIDFVITQLEADR